MDPASLELEGTGAVNGGHRGVGLLHPVHQPLDLTVAAERVPPQVSGQSVKRALFRVKENHHIFSIP